MKRTVLHKTWTKDLKFPVRVEVVVERDGEYSIHINGRMVLNEGKQLLPE